MVMKSKIMRKINTGYNYLTYGNLAQNNLAPVLISENAKYSYIY